MAWRSVKIFPPAEGEPVWINEDGIEYLGVCYEGVVLRSLTTQSPVQTWQDVKDSALWRTILPERQDVPDDGTKFLVDTLSDRSLRYFWATDEDYCRVATPDELRATLDVNIWWGSNEEFAYLSQSLGRIKFEQALRIQKKQEAQEAARKAQIKQREREYRESEEYKIIAVAKEIIWERIRALESEWGFELWAEYELDIDISVPSARALLKEHGKEIA